MTLHFCHPHCLIGLSGQWEKDPENFKFPIDQAVQAKIQTQTASSESPTSLKSKHLGAGMHRDHVNLLGPGPDPLSSVLNYPSQ